MRSHISSILGECRFVDYLTTMIFVVSITDAIQKIYQIDLQYFLDSTISQACENGLSSLSSIFELNVIKKTDAKQPKKVRNAYI